MDPRLLDLYLDELRYMQAMSGEFAAEHPKIARRLGMVGEEAGDPYARRLLETSAFVNARLQQGFADEFPLLTQALLSSVYPNYLAPTPSIAVARFYPGGESAGFLAGHTVKKGTDLTSHLPDAETTPCVFRTTQDVTLYPLAVEDVRLTDVPPDLQRLDRYVPPERRVRGALRLRLRTMDHAPFASLQNLDLLPVYLAGDEKTASHLHELIHTAALVSIVGEPGRFGEPGYSPHVVRSNAVIQNGLAINEAVLPLVSPQFHGHNLLQEYFACPARFFFFTLTGLRAGFACIQGCEAEVIVLLDHSTSDLAGRVDATMFALFCSPVVNLFRARTATASIHDGGRRVHLVPFEQSPLDYEVHSVERAIGQVSEDSDELLFRPLHQAVLHDEQDRGAYFTVLREKHVSKAKRRAYGTRTPYISTETFLSLVGRNGETYDRSDDDPINYLSVDAWLTNRDLPGLLRCNGVRDLNMRASAAIASIGFVRAPSRSRPSLATGKNAWKLVAQLSIGLSAFDDGFDETHQGEGLRRLLRLYLSDYMQAQQLQVESIISATLRPLYCVMPGKVPPMVRALECTVSLDENGFDGVSPYAFGTVLEHYLARHASSGSFTTTALRSKQRGHLAQWPPRAGTRTAG